MDSTASSCQQVVRVCGCIINGIPRFSFSLTPLFSLAPLSVLVTCTSNRSAAAFVQPSAKPASSTELYADRRAFLSAAAAAAVAAAPLAANAIRDYENVGLLGGSEIVDVNNANVRVYLKMPGMYPTVAGKIASNGPYNSVGDLYNIPGLSGKEKEMIKKYESRFTAQKPAADYVIDRINNGLYR
jgi:photosystem II PsbU protein